MLLHLSTLGLRNVDRGDEGGANANEVVFADPPELVAVGVPEKNGVGCTVVQNLDNADLVVGEPAACPTGAIGRDLEDTTEVELCVFNDLGDAERHFSFLWSSCG